MESQKFSVSIPKSLFLFVEEYQEEHQLRTRSDVIGLALRELQNHELEAQYREASNEVDQAFEVTNADGLEDEAW